MIKLILKLNLMKKTGAQAMRTTLATLSDGAVHADGSAVMLCPR
jgi:hypothetical protein